MVSAPSLPTTFRDMNEKRIQTDQKDNFFKILCGQQVTGNGIIVNMQPLCEQPLLHPITLLVSQYLCEDEQKEVTTAVQTELDAIVQQIIRPKLPGSSPVSSTPKTKSLRIILPGRGKIESRVTTGSLCVKEVSKCENKSVSESKTPMTGCSTPGSHVPVVFSPVCCSLQTLQRVRKSPASTSLLTSPRSRSQFGDVDAFMLPPTPTGFRANTWEVKEQIKCPQFKIVDPTPETIPSVPVEDGDSSEEDISTEAFYLRHQKCLYNLSETYARLSKRRKKAPAVEPKHTLPHSGPFGLSLLGNSRDSTATDLKRAKEKEAEDRELVREVEKEMVEVMKQYKHPPAPPDILRPIEFNYCATPKPPKQYRRPKSYIKCLSDMESNAENDPTTPAPTIETLEEPEVPLPKKRDVIMTPAHDPRAPTRNMRLNRKKRKFDQDLDGPEQRSQFITPRKSGRKRWFKDPDLRDEPPPLRHLLDRPKPFPKILLAPAQEVLLVQKRVAELKLRCLALRCQQLKLRAPSSTSPPSTPSSILPVESAAPVLVC